MKKEHREFRDGDIEEEIREAFQVFYQSYDFAAFHLTLKKNMSKTDEAPYAIKGLGWDGMDGVQVW